MARSERRRTLDNARAAHESAVNEVRRRAEELAGSERKLLEARQTAPASEALRHARAEAAAADEAVRRALDEERRLAVSDRDEIERRQVLASALAARVQLEQQVSELSRRVRRHREPPPADREALELLQRQLEQAREVENAAQLAIAAHDAERRDSLDAARRAVAETRTRFTRAQRALERAEREAPSGGPVVAAAEREVLEAEALLEDARIKERAAGSAVATLELGGSREELLAAREARDALSARAALARAHWSALARTRPPDDDELRLADEARVDAERSLAEARALESTLKDRLPGELSKWLPPDPEGEIARLETKYPIVLFPVRIETRFDVRPGQTPRLKVRVYPDEILSNEHDRRLTSAEVVAARTFWTDGWNPADEEEAWKALLRDYPPERAAWLVRETEPENLDDRPGTPPQFPADYADPSTFPPTLARAAEAHLLPDRWLVLAFRGGAEVRRAVSAPIRGPLTLIPDPEAPDSELINLSADGPAIDRDVFWVYDFAQAEAQGMAVQLPLDAADLASGFDRLFVLGVKSSLTPEEGGAELAAMIENHHHGRGLELVRQGTPTNTTSEVSSGYPPDDRDGARSFTLERRGATPGPGTDGERLMHALGLPASLAANLGGASRTEELNAMAMNLALWPATFGYALEQMMSPVFDRFQIEDGRRYFVRYVRGRGPLPAFRVGDTPYGVLPVASLNHWRPDPDTSRTDRALPDGLRRLSALWQSQIPAVPRVGRTPNDPDRDLVEILGMNPSARQVRVRALWGPYYYWNLFGFFSFGYYWPSWSQAQWQITNQLLEAIGHPAWTPWLAQAGYDFWSYVFSGPMVGPAPLSEDNPLPGTPNYIEWIRTASVDDLRAERFPPGAATPAPPTALLYLMLRHAALLEYRGAAIDLLSEVGHNETNLRLEHELVGIVPGTLERPLVWQYLDQEIPGLTDGPVKNYLATAPAEGLTSNLGQFRGAIAHLATLPTAELDRLFTETLDTCSHRLDAWITSLAAARLQQIRRGQQISGEPVGSYIGAFGWVEDLRRTPPGALRTLADGRSFHVQAQSGGYIHAPSQSHAAAAAILRNGYLSRSGEARDRFNIDLSSSRVRLAQWLLDGVRNGLPLAAIFGYLFERALHDRSLDIYIEPLRLKFPMPVLNQPTAGQAQEAIAARDVVNGWDLYQSADPFAGLSASATDLAALGEEHRHLQQSADAIADLLCADSVFQLVRGNMPSAANSLDALSKGARPPDPEIVRAPRGGTALTHRVAVIFGGNPLARAAGWANTQRSTAEPYLDGWVGRLMGDPDDVRCRVTYLDPTTTDPQRRSSMTVSLTDLGLAPLDVLALGSEMASEAAASQLDRLVTYFVLASAPATTEVQITYAGDPTWNRTAIRTFPEILEIARAINEVVSTSRPLNPGDLRLPETPTDIPAANLLTAETMARATGARTRLGQSRTTLEGAYTAVVGGQADLDGLRAALVAAVQFGIGGAVPDTRQGNAPDRRERLLAQAESVLREMGSRLERATAATEPVPIARAVFGEDFVLVPRFRPVDDGELAQAIAEGPALSGGPLETRKWMQGAARVHAGLARWRRLALYAGAMNAPVAEGEVAQLPHVAGARWVALPFASESQRPPAGRVSIVMHREQKPAVADPWAGLLLDEWPELIPNTTELTGVAFHYDDPGAEAAQAVLIAVPPTSATRWDLPTLVDTLHETLDLIKLRAVDSDLLGELGHLLPAIYLAANAAGDTVATDFSGRRSADPEIVYPN